MGRVNRLYEQDVHGNFSSADCGIVKVSQNKLHMKYR